MSLRKRKKMDNELKIKEVEVTKLDLKPGQILTVKIYADDIWQEDLAELKEQLKELFPNNKIMLFALPIGSKIEMDVLDAVATVDCGLSPTSYCYDCSCGKKEKAEGKA